MILFALRAIYAAAPGDWYATADLGWTDDPAGAATFATHGQVRRWLDANYHLEGVVSVVPVDRPADLAHTRRPAPAPVPAGYVLAAAAPTGLAAGLNRLRLAQADRAEKGGR